MARLLVPTYDVHETMTFVSNLDVPGLAFDDVFHEGDHIVVPIRGPIHMLERVALALDMDYDDIEQ